MNALQDDNIVDDAASFMAEIHRKDRRPDHNSSWIALETAFVTSRIDDFGRIVIEITGDDGGDRCDTVTMSLPPAFADRLRVALANTSK